MLEVLLIYKTYIISKPTFNLFLTRDLAGFSVMMSW